MEINKGPELLAQRVQDDISCYTFHTFYHYEPYVIHDVSTIINVVRHQDLSRRIVRVGRG